MNKARCRPGDLAVVISARIPANLGRIVHVVQLDDGTGDLRFSKESIVWVVQSDKQMGWEVGKRKVYRKRGPVPDTQLQPIRGYRPALDNEAFRTPTASEEPSRAKTY